MSAAPMIEVEVLESDASWLGSAGGRRLRLLEHIAGAGEGSAKIEESKVLIELPDSAGGGRAWAEHCVKAMCAMHGGETLDVSPLPEATESWTPAVCEVRVPKDEAKGYISGRQGARLMEESDTNNVLSIFVREMKPVKEKKPFEIEKGVLLEAKFEGGERWFKAIVKEVLEDKVKVKWTYDDDVPEGEVPKDSVRELPVKAEAMEDEEDEAKIEVGSLCEAKFDGKGDRWFEVKVLEVDKKTAKVKWTYDDTLPASEVDLDGIRPKPKPKTEKLRIYGAHRSRMVMELKIWHLIENKLPGYVSSQTHSKSAVDGIGLTIHPLLNDGEFKAKVIGKQGSVRKRLEKACGCAIEYLGNSSFVVGTVAQRAHAAGLIDLVQGVSNVDIPKIPDALEDMCTEVVLPDAAFRSVIGAKRATMNQLEEEAGIISVCCVPKPKEEEKSEPTEELTPAKGDKFEGRFVHPKGDRWFECTVVSVSEAEGDKKSMVKVQWDYDPEEKSEIAISDLRKIGSAPKETNSRGADKLLAIFGQERNRKIAELAVMALIESAVPDTFAKIESNDIEDGFGMETIKAESAEKDRLKKDTLRNVGLASSCVIELIGSVVCVAGDHTERNRGKEYVGLLKSEVVKVNDVESRSDVTTHDVPKDKEANMAEWALDMIGKETSTFIIFEGGAADRARLLIFGPTDASRKYAIAKLVEQQDYKPKRAYGDSGAEPEAKRPKVEYIVTDAETEKRKLRAARFA